ncbi:hypothetical protein N2152v2_003920 [Parachlorella kessleri]
MPRTKDAEKNPENAEKTGIAQLGSHLGPEKRSVRRVPNCTSEPGEGDAKYYKRFRICRQHATQASVDLEGQVVRFCQQCGRFQHISDFDGDRRSCRASLEKHNARRRRAATTATTNKIPAYGRVNAAYLRSQQLLQQSGGDVRSGDSSPAQHSRPTSQQQLVQSPGAPSLHRQQQQQQQQGGFPPLEHLEQQQQQQQQQQQHGGAAAAAPYELSKQQQLQLLLMRLQQAPRAAELMATLGLTQQQQQPSLQAVQQQQQQQPDWGAAAAEQLARLARQLPGPSAQLDPLLEAWQLLGPGQALGAQGREAEEAQQQSLTSFTAPSLQGAGAGALLKSTASVQQPGVGALGPAAAARLQGLPGLLQRELLLRAAGSAGGDSAVSSLLPELDLLQQQQQQLLPRQGSLLGSGAAFPPQPTATVPINPAAAQLQRAPITCQPSRPLPTQQQQQQQAELQWQLHALGASRAPSLPTSPYDLPLRQPSVPAAGSDWQRWPSGEPEAQSSSGGAGGAAATAGVGAGFGSWPPPAPSEAPPAAAAAPQYRFSSGGGSGFGLAPAGSTAATRASRALDLQAALERVSRRWFNLAPDHLAPHVREGVLRLIEEDPEFADQAAPPL